MLRRNSADRSRCSICLPNIYSSVTFSTSTRWVFILELSIDESSELSSRRLRFTSDEHVSDSVVSSSIAASSVGWIKNDKNISSFSPLCAYTEYTHSYYGTLPNCSFSDPADMNDNQLWILLWNWNSEPSAHRHRLHTDGFLQVRCPSCCPTNSVNIKAFTLYNWTMAGSHIQSTEWCHCGGPWVTL